jgi:hypothetical protein
MFELVKAFLAELRSLNNNLQKQSQAINEATKCAKEHESKTPEVRAVLNFLESLQRSKEAAGKREQKYQKRNLLLGLATLISLVIYAITTIFIYRATDRAATATEIAAKAAAAAADEATRSRIQAEKSLQSSIEQARLEQRAWVSVRFADLTFQSGNPVQSKMTVQNSGKTVARNVTVHHSIAFSSTQLTSLPPYPAQTGAEAILFPGIPIEVKVTTRTMTDEDIVLLKSGNRFMYEYGTVQYDDVFGRHHRTEICVTLNAKTRSNNPCRFHNYAD